MKPTLNRIILMEVKMKNQLIKMPRPLSEIDADLRSTDINDYNKLDSLYVERRSSSLLVNNPRRLALYNRLISAQSSPTAPDSTTTPTA